MQVARSFTPNELAKRWRCRPAAVRALIRDGRLKAIAFGSRVRVTPEALAEYEQHQAVEPTKPKKRATRRAADWVEYF